MSGKPLLNILKREVKSYFISPIAYIVILIYLVVTGWFFFSTFFLSQRADLREFFSLVPLILAFVVPAVTMRLFSEEFSSGSYEILFTLPVNSYHILFGKYLASLMFILLMIIPTISYPIFISRFGDLDWGPVIGGYIGTILLAAVYCAIGLFASSLTKNQIVAFIIALAVCFFLFLVDKILFLLPGFLAGFVQFLGVDYHFSNIAKGIIDSRDVIYFVSVGALALYATHIVINEKQ